MTETKDYNTLTDDLLKKGKKMYMDFVPVKTIAAKLNCNYNTLYSIVRRHWKAERDIFQSNLLSEISESKKRHITEIADLTLNLLINCLKDVSKRGTPLTPYEAQVFTKIYSDFDKVIRLDEGNPTDIVASTKPSTIVELKERLKKDPFDIEEAQYIELIENKKEKEKNEKDTNNINVAKLRKSNESKRD